MKVTVVGGGSTYTPELVDGIARLKQMFGVDELVLTDPAEKRLALVAGISQRIFAKYGYSGQIKFTSDLDRAVSDAAVRSGAAKGSLGRDEAAASCRQVPRSRLRPARGRHLTRR
jgi:alpha-galactosidase/6-phospho-beta-glucosidase family protein